MLAQLPEPTAHRPENIAAVLISLQVLCDIARPLSPALKRRLAPWREVEAQRRAEVLEDLRTSPVAAPHGSVTSVSGG